MLYDPRWNKKKDVKLGPVSMLGLIAWLEARPKYEPYDYCDMRGCVLGQFMQAQGLSGEASEVDLGFNDDPDQESWQRQLKTVAQPHPQTFGAALIRARSLLSELAAE